MTDQEMLNAIDAEIANTLKRIWHISPKFDIAAEIEVGCNSYINGLVFARDLIAKRMEAS